MTVSTQNLAALNLDGLSVGERLKKVRGEISQDAFASALGISRNTLIRYEKGERLPDIDLVLKLNFSHNVQPIWLLTGSHEPFFGGLSKDEKLMLDAFRNTDDQARRALLTLCQRLNELKFIAETATDTIKKARRT